MSIPVKQRLLQQWLPLTATLWAIACLWLPLLDRSLTKNAAALILISAVPLALLSRHLGKPDAPTARRFAWFSLGLLASVVLNIALLDNILDDGGKTGLYSFYLIPLLLLPLLKLGQLDKQRFSIALALIAITSGILALIEYSYFQTRAGELLHGQPIPFGNLSLCCALLCLLFIHRDNSRRYNALLIAAVILGSVASLLSLTRGGWIAIPVALLFIGLHRLPSLNLRKLVAGAVLGTALGLIALTATEPGRQIQARFTLAYDEAQSYLREGTVGTSVGVRFALWGIAFEGFQEAPLLGQGIASFYDYKQRAIEAVPAAAQLERYRHPHNEYLELLFGRGLIGSAVFLLYLGGVFLLFRRLRDSDLALCGQTLILSYLIFCLTESFFSLHVALFFFVVICTILFYLHDQSSKPPVSR